MNPSRWRGTLLAFSLSLPAWAGPGITAEQVRAALPELEKQTAQLLQKTGVPGLAIAIVHRDRVVFLKGFGRRSVENDAPVDADTVFQLASVSKPLATTTLAILVGDGTITWDDRLSDRLPDFQLADPTVTRVLTLRDLLCHRSGLADHAGDLLEDLGYDRYEVLRRLRFLKSSAGFRADYAYTNFGFTAAAVAGARTAGKAWDDLTTERLYRPLGMTSTSSRFVDYALAKNRAVLHVREEGKWLARSERNPDAQAPAGGASSSVRDLSRWLRLLLGKGQFEGKQIIKPEALAETFRPQIISNPPKNPATDRATFYGLGWNVSYDDEGRVHLGHSGAFSLGAATHVSLLPAEELGIVVLTNAAPIGLPETVAATFLDHVTHGKVTRDWAKLYEEGFAKLMKPNYGTTVDYTRPPAQVTPAGEGYAGKYSNDYLGEIEVTKAGDGSLTLLLGPKQTPFALKHRTRDVFIYQPPGESADGLSAVVFTIGVDGQASCVWIENLDVDGRGTLQRAKRRE